jgi:G3E family GTPase
MVKIDLITGFLGAGKTTFANLLLRHYLGQSLHPAYIANEFGQTGLDAALIGAEGFSATAIEGGCICCTLKHSVAATVNEVFKAYAPTNIVFESSGVFIPDGFWDILDDESLAGRCEAGSEVTIVDSANFKKQKAAFGGFFHSQIRHASVVVLSKIERAAQPVDELVCDIRNINPAARVVAESWEALSGADLGLLMALKPALRTGKHTHRHGGMQSVTVDVSREWTGADFDALAGHLRDGTLGEIIRVKGFVKHNGTLMLVNCVGREVEATCVAWPAEARLTFIGPRIQESCLRSQFT